MKQAFKILAFIVFAVLLAANLSSCGSSKTSTRVVEVKKKPEVVSKPSVPSTVLKSLEEELLKEARIWLGTPYKYGGNDKNGVDCSGYVLQIFKKVTDISLPRVSAQQYDYCIKISKDELEIGDLIFFTSPNAKGKVAHVGMYSGNGNMLHASSSKGVVEGPFETQYFTTHYIGSGRVPGYRELKTSKSGKTVVETENAAPKTAAANTQSSNSAKAKKEESKPSSKIKNDSNGKTKNVTSDEPTPDDVVRKAFGVK